MNDDFEEYLRGAQPAEPPPELMRRLRHAEPATGLAAVRWGRWASLAAAMVAAAALLGILVGSLPLFPAGDAVPARRAASAGAVLPTGDDHHGFGGSVAMNLQLGATPNLIPVSLRPNYDPRAPHSPAGLLVANPISESVPRF